MQMDIGKHPGNTIGTCTGDFDTSVAVVLARFLQVIDDIPRTAAGNAEQNEFHGPKPLIFAADIGRAVDVEAMAAIGGAGKMQATLPVDTCFHVSKPRLFNADHGGGSRAHQLLDRAAGIGVAPALLTDPQSAEDGVLQLPAEGRGAP